MRRTLLTILVICLIENGTHAQERNPKVTRERRLIYRIVEEIDVQVVQCKYFDNTHPALTYFDITQNCLETPKTGLFLDKWEGRNFVKSPAPLVDVRQYRARVDLIRNEIKLQSGTICRYDRGFCYDTKVNNNYAVVWEVTKALYRSVDSCPHKLEQLFFGNVDIWDFPEKNTKYLFYSDQSGSEAFFLKLVKVINCNNIETYVTDDNNFLVSGLKLTTRIENTRILNKHYLPVRTSKKVIEDIMRDYELHEFPLDFNNKFSREYFEYPESIRILFLKLKEEIKSLMNQAAAEGNSSELNKYLKNVEYIEVRIAEINTEIQDIINRLLSSKIDLGVTKNDIEKLNKLIYSSSQKCERDLVDLNNTLSAISENVFSESSRISKLVAEKESISQQEFEKLKRSVNNQMINFVSRSDFEERLSDTEGDLYTKIDELTLKVILSLEEHKQFENSLNNMRMKENMLDANFKNCKKQLNETVDTLVKQTTENFNILKNDYHTVLNEVKRSYSEYETDNKLADLKRDLEEFKISSAKQLEMESKYIYESIEDTAKSSATKLDLYSIKDQIDSLSENIGDVQWNILKNLKDDPISAILLNNKLSEVGAVINEKIKQLRADFTNELSEQKQECDCTRGFNDLVENYKKSVEDLQNECYEKAKVIVKTTGQQIKSELDVAVTDLKDQLEVNALKFAKTLMDRLQEKDKEINQLNIAFAKEVTKLHSRIDELSDKIDLNAERSIEAS